MKLFRIVKKNWGIWGVLGISLALRLIYLDQSLWLDEGIEWWAVTAFSLKQLLFGFMNGDFNPPGHYLLMWFWVRFFGDSEMVLRWPSVIFGVGTVGFVYKIGRALNWKDGGNLGLMAAAMAAVNGLLIYYSQEARAYAMAGFLVTGAMYFLIRKEKLGEWGYLGYLGCMTAALYTHYLTWLLVPFLVVFGIRYLLPIIFTVPWWPMMWKQLQVGLAVSQNIVWAGMGELNVKNAGLVGVKFVTGRIPFPEEILWQILILSLSAVFWGFAMTGVVKGFGKISGKNGSVFSWKNENVLLALWGFGPLLLGSVLSLKIPIFIYFRFLFVLPALILLLVAGIDGFGGRFGKILFWGVWGVWGIFSLFYLLDHNYQRENWKGAVGELHRLDVRPEVIINPAVRPPFDYYDRGYSKVIAAGDPGWPDDSWISVWYIPYAQPIFMPEDDARKKLMSLGFKNVYEKHFNGVTLEKWER